MWAPRDSCGLVETGGRPACLGGGTWIQLRSLEGAPSRRGGCEGLEQPRAWQSFQSRARRAQELCRHRTLCTSLSGAEARSWPH